MYIPYFITYDFNFASNIAWLIVLKDLVMVNEDNPTKLTFVEFSFENRSEQGCPFSRGFFSKPKLAV